MTVTPLPALLVLKIATAAGAPRPVLGIYWLTRATGATCLTQGAQTSPDPANQAPGIQEAAIGMANPPTNGENLTALRASS